MIKQLNIRSSYELYEHTSSKPVEYNVYAHIVKGFCKFIIRKVLEGFRVQLSDGESLGALLVIGRKVNIYIDEVTGNLRGGVVDWPATKDMWRRRPEAEKKEYLYYTNEHTNNIQYKVRWDKTDARLANKSFYEFKLTRANKRASSRVFMSGKEFYVMEKKILS